MKLAACEGNSSSFLDSPEHSAAVVIMGTMGSRTSLDESEVFSLITIRCLCACEAWPFSGSVMDICQPKSLMEMEYLSRAKTTGRAARRRTAARSQLKARRSRATPAREMELWPSWTSSLTMRTGRQGGSAGASCGSWRSGSIPGPWRWTWHSLDAVRDQGGLGLDNYIGGVRQRAFSKAIRMKVLKKSGRLRGSQISFIK
jgi:hypothetical protein